MMWQPDFTMALIGGALIGVATVIMLVFNGRVTGISGITNGAVFGEKEDRPWRWAFILGLLVGGALMLAIRPELFAVGESKPLWMIALAGLLVGYGTIMGSGCTSGHAVCGISRLSPRSVVSTVIFMAFGFATASLMQLVLG